MANSIRVIQLDQTVDNLKSRGEFATRVIGLSYGITAKELFPHVVKLGAKTCYFPHIRNNRKKNETIISFALKEECDNAIEFKWKTVNFNIQIATKRIEKFGAMYKKYNSHYFKIISRQAGEKTYAKVVKNKINRNYDNNNSEYDEDMVRSDDEENNINNNNKGKAISTKIPSTEDKVIEMLQQIVGHVSSLEQKIKESLPNTRDMKSTVNNNHFFNVATHNVKDFNDPVK
ncbi:11912_t:CDS:2, partial [Diversispora eburnea]